MRLPLACASLLALACSCGTSPGGEAPPPPAGPSVLTLGPGEVAELPVKDGAAVARVATPEGGEELLLILASMRFDGNKAPVHYEVDTEAAPGPPAEGAALVTGCSVPGGAWGDRPLPREDPPAGTAVAVGAQRTLNVLSGGGSEPITARAVAVSKGAVIWADATPGRVANLDPAFVSRFLADFDDTILPRERAVYGVESDLDRDGHIGVVFTALTYRTAVAFFTPCDLGGPGCPAGNGGEYLYLTPPESIDPPYNTPDAIKETLAHELGHLLHFNRKVLRNQSAVWADSNYMIEGVGGFTQDFSGYQAGNLYVAKAGLDQINRFSLAEVLIDRRPYDTARDGALRGGAYWFVRWLYDRAGGDVAQQDGTLRSTGGPAFFRALVDARPSMAGQLPTQVGAPIADVATDFYTALGISNRGDAGGAAPQNGCFSFLPTQLDPVTARQRGGSTFASFHGMKMTGPAVRDVADGSLLPGGVEYVRLRAAAGQPTLDISVIVDDPDVLPRVRLARLQ